MSDYTAKEKEEFLESISFWKHRKSGGDVRVVSETRNTVKAAPVDDDESPWVYTRRDFLKDFDPII